MNINPSFEDGIIVNEPELITIKEGLWKNARKQNRNEYI